MLNKYYPYILVVGGLTGIITSFLLTLDKIKLLQNPGVELPCNINPLISCGPVINTWQASVFGVPNPMLGIVGFSAVLTFGLILALGGTVSKLFNKIFITGISASVIFVHWLIFQSLYEIGALCLYCMITWVAIWPIFFFTVAKMIREHRLLAMTQIPPVYVSKRVEYIDRHPVQLFIIWYVVIIFLILVQFRDFFFG